MTNTEKDIWVMGLVGVFVGVIDKWVEFIVWVCVMGMFNTNTFTYKSLMIAAGL